MKKLLLGTAAMLTLTSAAQAGPALDALTALLPTDTRVTFEAERAEGGVEVYEGLELSAPGVLTRFDEARLSRASGLFGLDGSGVRSTDQGGVSVEVDTLNVSAPLSLFNADLSAVAGDPAEIGNTVCGLFTDPLRIDASGVRLPDAGRIGALRLTTSTEQADGFCALDLDQSMSGLEVVPPQGVGFRVEEQSLRARGPVTIGILEVATGERFSSELSVRNAEVSMDGAAQIRIGEMTSRSVFDADSALPLARAGYNHHLDALTAALLEMRSPATQLPYADLWNGARSLNTDGSVRVSGVEIVGPALAPLSPAPGLLDQGARLDLELRLAKVAELVDLGIRVDGTSTMLFDLAGGIRIEEADPSFNALPPRALLSAAPLSLASGSLRLSDRGVGAAGAQLLGADPYAMIAPALGGLIGEANAQSLSEWVSGARDGGLATIVAAPTEPVPLLMIAMMGLGDWSALGQMLNVSR